MFVPLLFGFCCISFRFATRKYDVDVKIDDEFVDVICAAASRVAQDPANGSRTAGFEILLN